MWRRIRRYFSPRSMGAAVLYLSAALGILYKVVDAAGNAEFVSGHLGGLDGLVDFLTHPATLLVTLVVSTALLLTSTPMAGIPFDRIDMARMKRREKFGVLWRPIMQEDGAITVTDPFCAEHLRVLKYRERNFLFGALQLLENSPAIGLALAPPPGIVSPPEPITPEGILHQLRGLPTPEPDPEPEWKLRDLTDNDRSGVDRGPWCEGCEGWKVIPKTIGDCKLEVRAEVRDELGL